MKVGMFIGKVKKFGIGWCIPHRMAADNALCRVKFTGFLEFQYSVKNYWYWEHRILKRQMSLENTAKSK